MKLQGSLTTTLALAILALPACAAHAVTFTSTDVPKNLGDVVVQSGTTTAITDNATATATATIPSAVTVGTVQVRNIDIAHTFPGDLDVFLTSPSNTTVELFTDVCAGGDWTAANTGFTLIPDATSLIGSTCPPGGGSFRPEGNLNVFAGEPGAGTWTLTIVDDAGGDTGSLSGWSLAILPQTSSTITVPAGPNVRSLAVTGIRIAHTFPGDLAVALRSPAGTTVSLINRVCGGDDWTSANTGFSLVAGAANPIGSVCPPGAETYAPAGDLGAFTGQSSSGNWTLTVSDLASADSGTLEGWSLQLADPPDTTITAGPPDASTSPGADFSFTSDVGGSTFECSLDGASFTGCSSPASFSGLGSGSHTFAVRAVDGVGNVDPSPATRSWTVSLPPQVVTVRQPRQLFATARLRAVPTRNGIRVRSLTVNARRGARISIRCRPRRACPAQSRTARNVSFRAFRGRRLRAGTRLQIRVTRRNAIGRFIEFRILRGNFRRLPDRCLPPGSSRPQRCR